MHVVELVGLVAITLLGVLTLRGSRKITRFEGAILVGRLRRVHRLLRAPVAHPRAWARWPRPQDAATWYLRSARATDRQVRVSSRSIAQRLQRRAMKRTLAVARPAAGPSADRDQQQSPLAAPRGDVQVDRRVPSIGRGLRRRRPPAAVSNVIYLNNCKPNGCQINPGNDNATTNTSSIPDVSLDGQRVTRAATRPGTQVVECVQARRTRRSTSRSSPSARRAATTTWRSSPARRRTCSMQQRRRRRVAVLVRLHPQRDLVHVRERHAEQRRRAVLDRRAGDRALVGPRPQVRQPRSDDVSVGRPVDRSRSRTRPARAASTARASASAATQTPATRR